MRSIAIIIPARLESTRLPRKLLLPGAGGKFLLEQTYEAALRSRLAGEAVFIATASTEIFTAARNFGAEVIVTPAGCENGTIRTAHAAAYLRERGVLADWSVVINLQADEVEISPADVDALATAVLHKPVGDVGTLYYPAATDAERVCPDVVKAATGAGGRAVYFSRQAIPGGVHLGVYAYRHSTLQAIAGDYPSPLATAERLEQLAWLEQGRAVWCVAAEHKPHAINTPQDYFSYRVRHGLSTGDDDGAGFDQSAALVG